MNATAFVRFRRNSDAIRVFSNPEVPEACSHNVRRNNE